MSGFYQGNVVCFRRLTSRFTGMLRLLQSFTSTLRMATLLASTLFLAACASKSEKPEYVPISDYNPFGFQEVSLGQGVWAVRFVARPDMPMADVESYALRRASELAVKHGKPGFDLQQKVCDESTASLTMPDHQGGGNQLIVQANVNAIVLPAQDPTFPGYTREVPAKRCLLQVELVDQL